MQTEYQQIFPISHCKKWASMLFIHHILGTPTLFSTLHQHIYIIYINFIARRQQTLSARSFPLVQVYYHSSRLRRIARHQTISFFFIGADLSIQHTSTNVNPTTEQAVLEVQWCWSLFQEVRWGCLPPWHWCLSLCYYSLALDDPSLVLLCYEEHPTRI